MPGIVGLITRRPPELARCQLLRMVNALRHEPSYIWGTWTDPQMGIYVGWVARRGSFSDKPPFVNETSELLLFFAGEEFADAQQIKELRKRGHEFSLEDGSYLVHIAEEDAAFPQTLNGRFHGLLVDRRTGKSTLFNDRYGMQRIYYHEAADAFYFAAEAKAILAVAPELRAADERSLAEFVTCGCVMQDRTFFKNIKVLPTASVWTFAGGVPERKGRYFDPSEWEQQGALDRETYYQQLREVFSRRLPNYFRGPEPVGVSLTGGLDSRMIMAWANAEPGTLSTYTFGGPYRECKDVIIARKVAQTCRQPYEVIPVGSEFLSRFGHYAERTVYLSDGCAAVNRAPDLFVNERAAEIAPVRMTGNYGSEILRRLRAFKPSDPAPALFEGEFLKQVSVAKETYSDIFRGHAVTFTAFRQAPWYQYGLLALEQTQLAVRSPFLDNEVVRTAFRAPDSDIVKSDLFETNGECSRLIADGNPELHRIPTDRGLGGEDTWSARISRAMLEFSFKAEYAYDYGMPQWLVRVDHALSMFHLERLFLGRHKFCHFRVWYRDRLADYVREMLLDSRTLSRSHINREVLKEMVQKHLQGTANYTTEIHRLLTIELQHRLFIDLH